MNQGGIAKRLVDFVMAILGKAARCPFSDKRRANALLRLFPVRPLPPQQP